MESIIVETRKPQGSYKLKNTSELILNCHKIVLPCPTPSSSTEFNSKLWYKANGKNRDAYRGTKVAVGSVAMKWMSNVERSTTHTRGTTLQTENQSNRKNENLSQLCKTRHKTCIEQRY